MYTQVSNHVKVLIGSARNFIRQIFDRRQQRRRERKVKDVTLVTVSDCKRQIGVVAFEGDVKLDTVASRVKSQGLMSVASALVLDKGYW